MVWNSILKALTVGLGLAGYVHAQGQTTAFTDPKTNIQFQQYTKGNFKFGIASPENKLAPDFIGRIEAKGEQGWAGVSFNGGMSNALMVVAWPYKGKIISSVRLSSGYNSPGPSTNSSIQLLPIEAGTSHDLFTNIWTLTFLCKGCIQGDGSTWKPTNDSPTLGWALGPAPPSDPEEPLSPMAFHSGGQGMWKVNLPASRSSKWGEWAKTAKASENAASGGARKAAAKDVTTSTSNSTYDYIVVGAGPAGLIAAQRLTETGKSVLLLERGMESTYSSGGKRVVPWNRTVTYYDMPGMFMNMLGMTEGEGFCQDTAGIAGCILGGGGTMNGMAFIHPAAHDFDDSWPAGWKSADVKAAADRLYARNPGTTSPSQDGKYYDSEIYDILSKWFTSSGWKETDTLKNPEEKTKIFSRPSLNVARGIRAGPIQSYLPLAQTKTNFKLQIRSKVMRVVREGPKITGVEIELSPTTREIIKLNPGGAVLIAAGATSTPRVLWRSGIGRPKEIKTVQEGRIKITLPDEKDWINLPVGEKFKDHSRFQINFNITENFNTYTNKQLLEALKPDIDLYQQGSGVYAQSFMRMDIFTNIKTSKGNTHYFQSHIAAPNPGQVEFTLMQTHGTTSEGTLSINGGGNTIFSKEPWNNTEDDKEAWKILLNQLFEMTRKPGSVIVYSGGKDATADAILSAPAQQTVHFAGGARMGTDDGRTGGTAVVDTDTRVYGTDNLYVVDATMHPDLSTGNSQTYVMVAAEHAVQKIIARK